MSPLPNSRPPSVFLWILLVGGMGFAAGFFGPIVLTPEANQGPLVGIFISGPLGVLLGLILYAASRVLRWTAERRWQLLWGSSALVGLGTLSVFLRG